MYEKFIVICHESHGSMYEKFIVSCHESHGSMYEKFIVSCHESHGSNKAHQSTLHKSQKFLDMPLGRAQRRQSSFQCHFEIKGTQN